jgi:hypothetical protein
LYTEYYHQLTGGVGGRGEGVDEIINFNIT